MFVYRDILNMGRCQLLANKFGKENGLLPMWHVTGSLSII